VEHGDLGSIAGNDGGSTRHSVFADLEGGVNGTNSSTTIIRDLDVVPGVFAGRCFLTFRATNVEWDYSTWGNSCRELLNLQPDDVSNGVSEIISTCGGKLVKQVGSECARLATTYWILLVACTHRAAQRNGYEAIDQLALNENSIVAWTSILGAILGTRAWTREASEGSGALEVIRSLQGRWAEGAVLHNPGGGHG
jgi:hypothetical protein